MTRLKIALLAGGDSPEREIALQSAALIEAALDHSKYDITVIDLHGRDWHHTAPDGRQWQVDKNDFSITVDGVRKAFDYALIIIHGTPGEDGKLQGYLDMMGVPYSSCSMTSSVITFDKITAKRTLAGRVNLAREVFLRRGEGALGLGNIAIESVVLDGHEHVAGIDLLARLYVDFCHGSVDGRGDYRCRDRLELAFCLNRGRKRSFLDRLEYGLVCGLRFRAHDGGRNDSDEYDAGDDARDNAATDELLAAAFGTLDFELSVCLFIGDGRILLLGVCGGQERQGLSRVYGQVLDLVLGGAGILSHGASSIDSVSSMVYMLSSKVYMTTLDGVSCVRFLTSMLGTEGAARAASNCAQEANSTSVTAPPREPAIPLRKRSK